MSAPVLLTFFACFMFFALEDARYLHAGRLRSSGREPYFDRGRLGATTNSQIAIKCDSRYEGRGRRGVILLFLQPLAPILLFLVTGTAPFLCSVGCGLLVLPKM